jgi:phosphatidate cytidylyltransferase
MDSIAFFVGKNFGKRPFINNVSPNKTMEGFLSAVTIAPIFLLLTSSQAFELPIILVFVVLCLVSIFAVIGDAVASLMKRVVEVKDYSNLIPGHGGLFDRLDSHIAAFPCFIFLLNILS